MDNDNGLKPLIGCLTQALIAVGSLVVSLLIAAWQIHDGKENTRIAVESAHDIALQQAELTRQLDALEEWRRKPQLEVLRTIAVRRQEVNRTRRDEVNCTIQNVGGRDAVIFTIELAPTSPATEHKGAGPLSMNRPFVPGDRSKTEVVDLSGEDLQQDRSFVIDPALVIKPGETVTLKFIFPVPTQALDVWAETNAVDANSSGGLTRLFHFRPQL